MEKNDALARAQQSVESAQRNAPKRTVADLIRTKGKAFAEALAGSIDVDLFTSAAVGAIRSNPQLAQASELSLLNSLLKCAQLGLVPNTLGEAYIVPYKLKTGETVAELIIGYQGLVSLIRRSGFVTSIQTGVVRSGDVFEFEFGLEEKLRHVPNQEERGEITYFYAYALFTGGGRAFEVMTVDDVKRVRDKAPGSRKPGSPWQEHFEEMGRKTVLRKFSKWLPKSTRVLRGIEYDAEGKDIDARHSLGSDLYLGTTGDLPASLPPSEGFDAEPSDQSPTPEPTAPAAEPETPKRGRPPGSKNKVEPRPEPENPTEGFPIDENGKDAPGAPDLKPGQSVDLLTGEIRDPEADRQEAENRKRVEAELSGVPGFDD